MGKRPKPIGDCRICGAHGELSEEHVPPREAFNKGSFLRGKFEDGLPFGDGELINPEIIQGGVKMYTLCETCNNNTGSWYGADFVTWCRWGAEILRQTGGSPSLVYCHRAYPLRIIKQIATMFFSVLHDGFRDNAEDLVRFVLNKEERGLPPGYRFFAYYNVRSDLNKLRYAPEMGVLDIRNGDISLFSEITFPPYGYVLVLGDTKPPDKRLAEISHFANYGYRDKRDIQLPLPVLPTHFQLSGDYRSLSESHL